MTVSAEIKYACEANLFLDRLIHSHDSVTDSMRKALTYKDSVQLHQSCGIFVHFLGELSKMTPTETFNEASIELKRSFLSGFLDMDLQHCLQTQVPPGDCKQVAAFRRGGLIFGRSK